MSTQSRSHLTNSLPKADRIVDELRAAGFSPEEISVLAPQERPASVSAPNRAGEPARDGRGGTRNILVSVHLVGGRGMGRAEEIFGRAGSGEFHPARRQHEGAESWA